MATVTVQTVMYSHWGGGAHGEDPHSKRSAQVAMMEAGCHANAIYDAQHKRVRNAHDGFFMEPWPVSSVAVERTSSASSASTSWDDVPSASYNAPLRGSAQLRPCGYSAGDDVASLFPSPPLEPPAPVPNPSKQAAHQAQYSSVPLPTGCASPPACCPEPQLDGAVVEYLVACLEDEERAAAGSTLDGAMGPSCGDLHGAWGYGAGACSAFGNARHHAGSAEARLMLVDWMVEVCDEFRLAQETLFLAVALLDRLLALMVVPRGSLQLYGVTCLWVAAKYEEVNPPPLVDFVDMTDNSCTAAELVAAEAVLLRMLRFSLCGGGPHAFTFLTIFTAGAAAGRRAVQLAEYVLELGLLTPALLQYRPSVRAAAALVLARSLLSEPEPPCDLAAAIAMGAAHELAGCTAELRRMLSWANSCDVKPPMVRIKYSSPSRSCVALLLGAGMRW